MTRSLVSWTKLNSDPCMADSAAQLSIRRALVNQVFEITGIPVDADDPVIIAALLQSTYMQRAAKHAVAQIRREAEALAANAEQFGVLAKQIEANAGQRSADISTLTQKIQGIADDLRQTPAYPGWLSNLGLVFAGSVAGASLVLAVVGGMGLLH